MRASRATELVKDFPEHVVTAWMGHSKRIAQKHYAGHRRGLQAGQLKSDAADYRFASQGSNQYCQHEKNLVLQGLAIIRETMQTREVGDEGLELWCSKALYIQAALEQGTSRVAQGVACTSQVAALLIECDELDEEEKIAVQVIIDRY